MILLDSKGRINLVNVEIERLSGCRRDELLGCPLEAILPDGIASTTSFIRHRQDGNSVPVVIRKTRLRAGNEDFQLATIIDISTRDCKEAHLRLRDLEEHQDFVATLTHDLKAPLIGTDRVLELMVKESAGPLSEEQKTCLMQLKQSNADMLNLVQNLLDVYRLHKEPLDMESEIVDMKEQVALVKEQLRIYGEIEDVRIEIEFKGKNHKIEANAFSVRRILMNLIGNAIKFGPPGSTVIVRGRRQAGWYVLEVTDQGTGIPADELKKIFDRFRRGREGLRHESSTGLGLYLCKKLIEAHGGTIGCRSRTGSDTTFVARLPVKQSTPSS